MLSRSCRAGARLGRRMSTASQPDLLDIGKCEEVRIPVPWGHIAGKWWGDRSVQPVVATHGIQDNLATFDLLVPLLRVSSLLALDLPGHGWSSHLPFHINLHFMDNVLAMRRVLKEYFGWKDLELLGHSFGSSIWFAYAGIFPEDVKTYMSIDCGRYNLVPVCKTITSDLRRVMDFQLSAEEKAQRRAPPEYEFEELVEVMHKGRKPPMALSREACRVLLTRGTHITQSGLHRLSRDVRLKERHFGRMSEEFIMGLSRRLRCSVLYLRSEGGIIHGEKLEMHLRSVLQSRDAVPWLESHDVPGSHHVHLEHPGRVAPFINAFLARSQQHVSIQR